MKRFLIISLLVVMANHSEAAFMINTMTGYSSSSDSNTTTNISNISNHVFVGASIGSKQQIFVGQNITIYTQQLKTTTTDKISTMELGPRLTYFFNEENIFYSTLGWNPYAKGTRIVASTSEEISGFSYLIGLGAELKINRNFHIGGSLNYSSLNISKSISSANVATEVSDTYTALMPMINLSLRFR
jgi:hypothetical protein